MIKDCFESTSNWTFSEKEYQAESQFGKIQKQAIESLPKQMFSGKSLTLMDDIKKLKLYKLLQTIPKGVLHHLHFDCAEDKEYYAEHIVTDPIVYLNKEEDQFRIGTKEQAEKDGWISMEEIKKKFDTQEQFINKISNLTMLCKEEIQQLSDQQSSRWKAFEKKISNFFPILGAEHLFKKYATHCLRKYVRNGYDRIQFRAFLSGLTEYDAVGNIVAVHPEKRFTQIFDEAYVTVKKQHPQLTVGFIFFGLKMFSPQDNEKNLRNALSLDWKNTIGIDFVQQQDPYGSQAPYDEVANKVLQKFPHIKKVYHAGQTKNHFNNNVQISIKAGSVRIGHGINLLQHTHLIQICRQKKICFQLCPISNIFMTYCREPEQGVAPILQGIGIPVTINPDDPGKFGYEDSTMDYFFSFVCYNWTLKNLKLLGVHSINHSICSEAQKQYLMVSFATRWQKWINQLLHQ